jgi:hypothetical protein
MQLTNYTKMEALMFVDYILLLHSAYSGDTR